MKKIFSFILFFIGIHASSQYYIAGNDPAGLKWRQIKTPVVRLVFEESLQEYALQLAAYMDSMAPHISSSLNYTPKRIDLLLHNQTPTANGFVTWAPRRSEFFTIPAQNNVSTDWLEHLAIHEYRHVVQIGKLNSGFTKYAGYLLGQQAVGITLGLYLPLWWLEGDAVVTETTLTKSGRGRSFDFNSELKAQLLEKGVYSYDKAYMGSYRDQVPNYYKMGYMFTALARQEYGTELWENAITKTGRNNSLFNPFNKSIKNQTGLRKRNLYNHLFKQLKENWQKENDSLEFSSYRPLLSNQEEFLNYKHLVAIDDSTLIAELAGPGIRSQIISIHNSTGEITPLIYTGYRADEPLSANQKLIVWTEQQNHPRWEHKAQSVIKSYDRSSKKVKTLTRKNQYFSPSLHPKKDLLVAVEATTDYKNYLTILNSETGNPLQRIPTPKNYYLITPSWNKNGENIVCVLLTEEGKAIYSYYPETEQWQEITKPSYDEIRFPIQNESKLWYVAKGEISDELFLKDLNSGITQQLTSSEFGTNYPTLLPDGKVIYSNRTSNGWRPVLFEDKATSSKKIKNPSLVDQLAEELTQQELPLKEKKIKNTDTSNYSVEKYSKWNLFNVHSWAPAYVDFDNNNIHTGLSIMSQNLLSTMVLSAGYNADPAKKSEKYNLNFSYRGWFPIIDIIARMGDDRFVMEGVYENQEGYFEVQTNQRIDYLKLKAGLRIPLDFSRNNFYRTLQFASRFTFESRTGITFPTIEYRMINNKLTSTDNTSEQSLKKINFQGLEYNLYFHNLRHGTSRDVGTRMGQVVSLIYRHTPLGTYNNGSIVGATTKLYFPGIGRYHSISLNNEYQHTTNGELSHIIDNTHRYFRNSQLLSYPRGYNSLYSDDLYIFRGNYHLPLWNPDVALGGLIYLKRLRLMLFYDQAIGSYALSRSDGQPKETYKTSLYSTGMEVHADTHFFRFIMPFSVGYRVGLRSIDQKLFHELVISNSLSGFLVSSIKR